MDVFIRSAFKECWLPRLGPNLFESVNQRGAFFRGQNPHLLKRPRESLRSPAIAIEQPLIEIERSGKPLEDLRRSSLESPAPKFHDRGARTRACRVRTPANTSKRRKSK